MDSFYNWFNCSDTVNLIKATNVIAFPVCKPVLQTYVVPKCKLMARVGIPFS